MGGMRGSGSRSGRAVRLALALAGAVVVAAGFWVLGSAALHAFLIPAGTAYRLCSATCGSRFAGGSIARLVVAVLLMVFGGVLRLVGHARM
jgi:hypothetical protein